MSKNDKHISREDFQRYLENKMTDSERNTFERVLEKHPFEKEALEGLQQIDGNRIQPDLNEIRKNISKKTDRRKTRFWAAAATIFLLVSVGIIWIQLNDKSPVTEMAETKTVQNQENKVIPKIPEEVEDEVESNNRLQPAPMLQENETLSELQLQKDTTITTQSDLIVEDRESDDNTEIAISQQIDDEINLSDSEATPESFVDSSLTELTENKNVLQSSSIARMQTSSALKTTEDEKVMKAAHPMQALNTNQDLKNLLTGKVISIDDSMPLPGVSIIEIGTANGTISDINGNFSLEITNTNDSVFLASFVGMENTQFYFTGNSAVTVEMKPTQMALDEVTVVGYGVSDSKNLKGSISTVQNVKSEDSYAQPLPGMKSYEKYLEDNAFLPSDYEVSEATLKILLSIDSIGEIVNFENLNNANSVLYEKAKKIILDGPVWIPEVYNGKGVASKVNIEIVFKKSE